MLACSRATSRRVPGSRAPGCPSIEAANAANRSYYERAREPRRITSRITVPTGVALSTEAVQRVPRERAERSYADIRRWTEFPRGGHFFAAEEPRLLAEELRAFFRPFRGMS